VKALLRKGAQYYVAECMELAVVPQGKTPAETLANLQEAIACTWRVTTPPILA
jgi:predicted RNase H-like HicB family nuclease